MWKKPDYFIDLAEFHETLNCSELATVVYESVCRVEFSTPGFALIDAGTGVDSHEIRRFMVRLKTELSAMNRFFRQKDLNYLSMGRFDQQVTTKFHLDGAPEESILMLGYEPSAVASKLSMADYSRCAHDRGMEPKRFLDEHNPMFTKGAALLEKYVTELDGTNARHFQILVINNSSAAYGSGMQGVFHKAEIINPDPAQRRIVNSTMLAAVPPGTKETFSRNDQNAFVETDAISGPTAPMAPAKN